MSDATTTGSATVVLVPPQDGGHPWQVYGVYTETGKPYERGGFVFGLRTFSTSDPRPAEEYAEWLAKRLSAERTIIGPDAHAPREHGA